MAPLSSTLEMTPSVTTPGRQLSQSATIGSSDSSSVFLSVSATRFLSGSVASTRHFTAEPTLKRRSAFLRRMSAQ